MRGFFWAFALAVALFGCAGSFEEAKTAGVPAGIKLAPPSERCVSLDDTHRMFGAVEKGAAFLAGGAGLATIPEYDKTARVSVAIGAAAMGALAVTAAFVSQDAAVSWSRECSQ